MTIATALSLCIGMPIRRQRIALAAVMSADAPSLSTAAEVWSDFSRRAGAAWEHDMRPARSAIAGALHAGNDSALEDLHASLPVLLARINKHPALADVLGEEMEHAILDGIMQDRREEGALESREYVRDEDGRFAASPLPFSETARDFILERTKHLFGDNLSDHATKSILEHFGAQKENHLWRKKLANEKNARASRQAGGFWSGAAESAHGKTLMALARERDRETHALSALAHHIARQRRARLRVPLRSAEASFSHEPTVTPSMTQWGGRKIMPTAKGSAELRGLPSEVSIRKVFSARTANADYLDEVSRVVQDMLSGKINLATGRWELMKKLKQIGYDPATGFPGEFANIPPAVRGSMQDLSSEQRLNLMLRTNVALARNYGRVIEGNTPEALALYPAWELVRLGVRKIHRGAPGSHTAGWEERWEAAGESVGWLRTIHPSRCGGRMIAAKDSPIWPALADGEGGYTDTLGHPFPPFAWGSGMAWDVVSASEWDSFLNVTDVNRVSGPMKATLAPSDTEIRDVMRGLGPDFSAQLRSELEAA